MGGNTPTKCSIAVKEPTPEPLQIHTLTGLVDYIEADKDVLDDLDGETPFFHVVSHKEVELRPTLIGAFCQRKTFLSATPPESRGYPFGQWLDPESFIIALQAMFVPDETTAQTPGSGFLHQRRGSQDLR